MRISDCGHTECKEYSDVLFWNYVIVTFMCVFALAPFYPGLIFPVVIIGMIVGFVAEMSAQCRVFRRMRNGN